MLPHTSLFDRAGFEALLTEFRVSMRGLLAELCDDLSGSPSGPLVPVDFCRRVGSALKHEDFSHWRVVGWIEGLNDLVYLLDVQDQLRGDPDPRSFVESFLAACEEQFYEHTYLDELFPRRQPEARQFPARLRRLCARLACEATAEALFLVPGLASEWLADRRGVRWSVPVPTTANFERAEPAGTIALGLEGALLQARGPWGKSLRGFPHATAIVTRNGIDLSIGRMSWPLVVGDRVDARRWRVMRPRSVRADRPAVLTIGPTVVYDAHREPARVVRSSSTVSARIEGALKILAEAWPEGSVILGLLTQRIVPVKARGVVSYSYRHRPGLSFINCFDRDDLDLIDDLVHENSHHHLNLLLRKSVLIRGDRNREIFYSPWRRSLRPLRGILHATFTFTMGALLFARLARADVLRPRDRVRAQFRCLEETASVGYSLVDLDRAAHWGWLTRAGVRLVHVLRDHIAEASRLVARHEPAVRRSPWGKELRRHKDELARAASLYRREG